MLLKYKKKINNFDGWPKCAAGTGAGLFDLRATAANSAGQCLCRVLH
jgi:hypothetical protein